LSNDYIKELNYDRILEDDLKYPVRDNLFIFAHDTNILGILFSLFDTKFLTQNEFILVEFVAHLVFEVIEDASVKSKILVKNSDKNKFYVKVLYMDKEIFFEKCHDKRCKLDDFLKILQEITN
jgi:hypothetical protein